MSGQQCCQQSHRRGVQAVEALTGGALLVSIPQASQHAVLNFRLQQADDNSRVFHDALGLHRRAGRVQQGLRAKHQPVPEATLPRRLRPTSERLELIRQHGHDLGRLGRPKVVCHRQLPKHR